MLSIEGNDRKVTNSKLSQGLNKAQSMTLEFKSQGSGQRHPAINAEFGKGMYGF